MSKRLLALLVFIPMFLIALYARNGRSPATLPTTSSRSAEPRDGHDSRDSNREGRSNRNDRGYRNDHEDRADRNEQDTQNTRNDRYDGNDRDDRSDRNEQPYRRSSRSESASSTPGTFDFYLLNLSWSPEFCATHPGKPECAAKSGFVLHGLWPQNNDGSYPEHCASTPGPADPGAFSDIYPDAGLLQHEWSTHGTCSGLAPTNFFTDARTAAHRIVIPPTLRNLTSPLALTPDAVRQAFASVNRIQPESIAVSCGNNYLTAVEVCLDKSLAPIACNSVRTCRANSIRIVPPGGSPESSNRQDSYDH